MTRAGRIACITVGLSVSGALLGGVAGAAALSAALFVTRDPWWTLGLTVGAWFGAPLGALTAPALAWLLLRRVPLGRMFAGCTMGTMAGGIIGWITMTGEAEALSGLAGAFVGCAVAATLLRYRALRVPRARRRLEA